MAHRRLAISRRLVFSALIAVVASVSIAHASDPSELPAELRMKPGFRLEVVYRVPSEQGSWVSLSADRRSRLIASDQAGKLYVIWPAPIGGSLAETRVEPLPVELGEAQGLTVVGDDLYVVVNSPSRRLVTGLHRARDTDGDGLWDASELLRKLPGKGEHGPHAVIADPTGKTLYICCGNDTAPLEFDRELLPGIGPDDSVLSRLIEPTPWHGPYRAPPAGWIARTDLRGQRWVLVSAGYRNQYDLAMNRDGELFTYDSDMEYDIGTPWYRPTRVCHVTSGFDNGWRSGAGKFPPHYPDTLPPLAELGPGSPTGLAFGYDTNFPAPYRDALFAADWGRGIIHALLLEPHGASYTAKTETLARAAPLPVTDLAPDAADGALYFTTGGRGIESTLYRIVYTGERPTASPAVPSDREAAAARSLRRRLEELHQPHPDAIATAWPALDHADRFIRYAARLAIEHQQVAHWRARALTEPKPARRIAACLALLRMDPNVSPPAIVAALSELSWTDLSRTEKRDCLRAYEVLLARHGSLSAPEAARLAEQLLAYFPARESQADRMLGSVLSRLGDPRITARLVKHFEQAWNDEDRIHLAHALCDVTAGWTGSLREAYFNHLADLIARYRDSTLRTYLDQIAARALESVPQSQRGALQQCIESASAADATAEQPSRPFVREWTIEEALETLNASRRSPDLPRGERLFVEARCATCHRFKGRGGAVGPDLTSVAGRFTVRDLLTAIIDPDQSIADQYRQTLFQIGGRVIVGTIIDQREGQVRIATDMTDPKRSEYVPLDEVESQTPSTVSPMPRGLVDVLHPDELVDLIAYLRAESGR